MVHVIAIRDGESKEAEFCCAAHARYECQKDPLVSWWETFDTRGNMVDSADKCIEEGGGDLHAGH